MSNKIVNLIRRNYIYVNITFVCLIVYVILFPIISIPVGIIFPQFNQCPYLRLTGKPCPLCGGTRYIAGLITVFTDITYLFHPFGVIVIVLFFELIFRVYNIINRKKERSKRWIYIDLFIHLLLLIIFLSYEIFFLALQRMSF